VYFAAVTELAVLVEASTTFLGILAGSVTVVSGWFAALEWLAGSPPEWVAQRVNEGLALGFLISLPWAMVAFNVAVIG
jgi:hypothetical protein